MSIFSQAKEFANLDKPSFINNLKSKYESGSDCILIDKNIKELDVKITNYRKLDLEGKLTLTQKLVELSTLEKIRTDLKLKFNSLDCVFNIEKKKLIETADILSEGLKGSEVDILEKSKKEQYIMFGIGGVVILSGLFIILKK